MLAQVSQLLIYAIILHNDLTSTYLLVAYAHSPCHFNKQKTKKEKEKKEKKGEKKTRPHVLQISTHCFARHLGDFSTATIRKFTMVFKR
jgi:hypothetical protein